MDPSLRGYKGNLRSLSVIDGVRLLCIDLGLLDVSIDNDIGFGDQVQRWHNQAK